MEQPGLTIVVLRPLASSEVEVLKQMENCQLYFESPAFVASLPEKFSSHQIDFKSVYESSYEESFECLLNASSLKIDGQLLPEYLCTENAYWWYYIRFMLLYKHRLALYNIRLLDHLKEILPESSEIHLYHESGIINEQIQAPFISHYTPTKKTSHKLKNTLMFLLSFFLRAFVGLFQLGQVFKKHRSILLSNAQANQAVISRSDFKVKGGDHFTEYLQEEIADRPEFLNLSESFPPKLDGKKTFKITRNLIFPRFSNTLHLETILLLKGLNPFAWYRASQQIKALNQQLAGIDLDQFSVEDRLIFRYIPSHKRLLFFLILRREILKTFKKLGRVHSIGGTNEHDTRVKSILDVARFGGTATFGIQHGVIHPKHMHYIFRSEDQNFQPYPDLTMLWGDYWKETLIKHSAYPPEFLLSLGQIRTDIIPKLNALKKSDLLPQLDNQAPLVLYPSQPLYEGEQQMRKRLATDFLKLTLDFPEVQFMIKPHPLENDYRPFFNHLASELKTSNFHFVNTDLYKTLAVSDLVIVYNSTVGGEAAYFLKPLIVMNYANNDFSGFVRSKIGKGTHSYVELKEALQKLLDTNFAVSNTDQQNFIQQRAFKIDGKTALRYIESISKLAR